MYTANTQKGISLVEVVIATSLLLGITLGVLGAYSFFIRTAFDNTSTLKATLLLEEEGELIRFFRDVGWASYIDTLNPGTPYYFMNNGSTWEIVSTPIYTDGFERRFYVSPIYRDAFDDIASTGTLDPDTVEVTIEVLYSRRTATTTRTATLLLSNLFE